MINTLSLTITVITDKFPRTQQSVFQPFSFTLLQQYIIY